MAAIDYERINRLSGRARNFALAVAQAKEGSRKYCMCISPIMGSTVTVSWASWTYRKCKICGEIIPESANGGC